MSGPVSLSRMPGAHAGPVGWQASFLLLATIWGSSFLLIKISLDVLAPVQIALARAAFGAATLLALLASRSERLPRSPRLWARLAVVALLLNTLPFSLYSFGETLVTSVLAGIWNATTPLLTLLVATVVIPHERPTRQRIAGLLVGFVGALLVLGPWEGLEAGALIGNLACLGAALSLSLGAPYGQRQMAGRPESALSLAAAVLLCGTAELAMLSFVLAEPVGTVSPSVLAAVFFLGTAGTGVAYILYTHIIRTAGATISATVTYLVLVFSTAAGVVFLDERITWNQPVGGLVVILGVAISSGLLRWATRAERGRDDPVGAGPAS